VKSCISCDVTPSHWVSSGSLIFLSLNAIPEFEAGTDPIAGYLVFYPEDGNSMFLRWVGKLLPHYTASPPFKFTSVASCNQHRLGVPENRVLRRIFLPVREEVTVGWRELYNEVKGGEKVKLPCA
jgi:hypothetical protein